MKFIPPILTCLIVGLLAGAIAIVSVQNSTLISVNFFTLQSIRLSVGVILALSFAVGIIIAAILQPLFNSMYSKQQKNSHKHS